MIYSMLWWNFLRVVTLENMNPSCWSRWQRSRCKVDQVPSRCDWWSRPWLGIWAMIKLNCLPGLVIDNQLRQDHKVNYVPKTDWVTPFIPPNPMYLSGILCSHVCSNILQIFCLNSDEEDIVAENVWFFGWFKLCGHEPDSITHPFSSTPLKIQRGLLPRATNGTEYWKWRRLRQSGEDSTCMLDTTLKTPAPNRNNTCSQS
jgi:hypothetical protein